jgi:CheY-like chemotaxis protein
MTRQGVVLVADDDAVFRRVTARLLERVGLSCREAADAAEVFEQLASEEVDVLLCDINMPGNHDLELTRELAVVRPSLPVILVTGSPTFESAREAVGLKVHAYLVKPLKASNLEAEVKAAVEVRHMQRLLHSAREQIGALDSRLEQAATALEARADVGEVRGAYLDATMRTLVAAATRLQGLLGESDSEPSLTPRPQVIGALDCGYLLAALRETVLVLERTKDHFHSKDLALLRRKIELLLDSIGT